MEKIDLLLEESDEEQEANPETKDDEISIKNSDDGNNEEGHQPPAKKIFRGQERDSKWDLWKQRETEENQLRRVQILQQQYSRPRFSFVEPAAPAEIAKRIAVAIKEKQLVALKDEIKSLLILNRSVPNHPDLSEVVNTTWLLWNADQLNLKLPLKHFTLDLRQSLFGIVVGDHIELIKFFNYPSPTSLVAKNLSAAFLYARLTGKQHARIRKAAIFAGANI